MRNSKQDRDVETLGVISSSGNQVFSRLLLNQFYALPRVEARLYPGDIKEVFVAIDPCSGRHSRVGKDTSHFAIVSFYRRPIDNKFVLLGLEDVSSHDHITWGTVLRYHLTEIRKRSEFDRATVIGIPENMGDSTSYIAQIIQDTVQPSLTMQEGAWRDGLPSTGVIKQKMRTRTQTCLLGNQVLIENNLITSHEEGAQGVFALLQGQLAMYSELEKPGATPAHASTFRLTGKIGGRLDDLCTMFQFGLYGANEFLLNPAYAAQRQSVSVVA